ncbi:MAG: glycosyltransferase [Candidatus Omnitrophota bacterium]|nr:MAG: glycosyltransferase [Candidatus Omnitrophota bacterium]
MKIAVVAPPWIPVPPPKYGGIEIVVWNLVEGLRELGEEVIFFGHKDSKVSCPFYPYTKSPIHFGMDSPADEKSFVRELALKYAFSRAGYEKVDIIHDHTMFKSTVSTPVVHTIYSTATEGALMQCLELLKGEREYLVAISNRQKELYTTLNQNIKFADFVHPSINVKAIKWSDKKEDFFLCIGRASWEKGFDTIIRIAARAKIGLIMAVKTIEEEEEEYMRKEIEPLIAKHPKDLLFQLHHEIPRESLLDLLRRAKCTLTGDKWEQPFGIVMLESMACGTPVIAFRKGSAPEIIKDRETGFVVNTEDEMLEAIKKIDSIKPENCRKYVEENFSRKRMAKKYLDLYKDIISRK